MSGVQQLPDAVHTEPELDYCRKGEVAELRAEIERLRGVLKLRDTEIRRYQIAVSNIESALLGIDVRDLYPVGKEMQEIH